jgi:hypothetical protein
LMSRRGLVFVKRRIFLYVSLLEEWWLSRE